MRMSVSSLGIVGSVMVVVCIPACNRDARDSPVLADFGVATCKKPTVVTLFDPNDPCEPPRCGGGNSPVTNTFLINGLSIEGRGECNPAGIQLLPRSLSGGGCRSGADLTIVT